MTNNKAELGGYFPAEGCKTMDNIYTAELIETAKKIPIKGGGMGYASNMQTLNGLLSHSGEELIITDPMGEYSGQFNTQAAGLGNEEGK